MFTVYKDHADLGYRTTRTVRSEPEMRPLLKAGWALLPAELPVLVPVVIEHVPVVEDAPDVVLEMPPDVAPRKRGRPRKGA